MAPPGMYYMGSTYWAGSFGLGGDQTTWDSQTNTYSFNKDWLANELYKSGNLDSAWLIFFENHLECQNNICTKVVGIGTDECSTVGGQCGVIQTHKACVNNVCTSVQGAGTNECTIIGSSCIPPKKDNTLLYVGIITILGIAAYKVIKK